jgi:dienelactone hydrolase
MAIHTEIVNYAAGDTSLEGYLAYDADIAGQRPGVVVFGEWWGRTEYLERRARELAELGYIALAADVYGGGQTAADADEAGQLMNALLGDMSVATARVQAAVDTLGSQPQTDSARMGAMGYCLGGALSLHAARLGLDLKGVVSFHGSLGKTHAAKPGDIKARVLVCHGADDKFISDEELAGFKQEMADLDVDMKFVSYPGALHAFSNPEADENASKYGLALKYDAQVDRQSWQEMRDHWERVFA